MSGVTRRARGAARGLPGAGPRRFAAGRGIGRRLAGLAVLMAGAGPAAMSPAFAPPAAVAQSVPAIEAAAARYREAPAFCADFEQSIEVRLIRRIIESAGRICQQRPNLFSMRFSQPDGDLVVSDGEHFWVYYPSVDAEQVMRRPAADSPGGEDFIRELLDPPAARYEGGGGEAAAVGRLTVVPQSARTARYDAEEGEVEPVDGRDCRVVSLVPRQAGHYQRARVWLDLESHLIRRVEIHEQSGNVRTVTLRNMDLDPTLDPGTFVFDVPPGPA